MTIAGRVDRKSETWSSRFGFIMAAVGSSVGLGNIWRFTYTTGENGGGAFVIAYLVSIALIAFPLLAAEYAIGRRSGHSAVESVQALARASGKSELWGGLAWLGLARRLLHPHLLLRRLVLVHGLRAARLFGRLHGRRGSRSTSPPRVSSSVTSDLPRLLVCLAIFIGAAVVVVGRGVKRGIERASTILMPVFVLLFLVLLGFCDRRGRVRRGARLPHQCAGGRLLLRHAARCAGAVLLRNRRRRGGDDHLRRLSQGRRRCAAFGGDRRRRGYGCGAGRGADRVLAGLRGRAAIRARASAFCSSTCRSGSPQMPFGHIVGGAFFLLALFAALASSISLMEVAVSWLDERTGVTRWGAALGVGFAVFVIGAGYIYSREYIVLRRLRRGLAADAARRLPGCRLLRLGDREEADAGRDSAPLFPRVASAGALGDPDRHRRRSGHGRVGEAPAAAGEVTSSADAAAGC